jgi:hypothetical protein
MTIIVDVSLILSNIKLSTAVELCTKNPVEKSIHDGSQKCLLLLSDDDNQRLCLKILSSKFRAVELCTKNPVEKSIHDESKKCFALLRGLLLFRSQF